MGVQSYQPPAVSVPVATPPRVRVNILPYAPPPPTAPQLFAAPHVIGSPMPGRSSTPNAIAGTARPISRPAAIDPELYTGAPLGASTHLNGMRGTIVQHRKIRGAS